MFRLKESFKLFLSLIIKLADSRGSKFKYDLAIRLDPTNSVEIILPSSSYLLNVPGPKDKKLFTRKPYSKLNFGDAFHSWDAYNEISAPCLDSIGTLFICDSAVASKLAGAIFCLIAFTPNLNVFSP